MTGRIGTEEHGTTGMRQRKRCTCEPCKEAEAVYQKRLRYDHERGIRRLIPAEPCRQHIEMLLDAGASVYQIDQASGCNRTNLRRILAGEFANVQRTTAKRILSTTIEQCLSGVQRRVDSIGVRRRIEALEYLGHTKADIAKELGVSAAAVYDYTYTTFLFSDSVNAVHEVYLRMRERPGTSTRVRYMAYKRGARPWLCWDDETIDDPEAVPYDAACVVSHCTRAVDDVNLCTTHMRLVKKASNRFCNGKRYREAIERLSKAPKKDGQRTRAQIAELRDLGYGDESITSHLGLSDDYVARLRRKEAS